MIEVNYTAVLVAAIVAYIIGALWFSPVLFGKPWMKLTGKTDTDMQAAKKKGMSKTYFSHFLTTLVTAYVLFHFVAGWYTSQSELTATAIGLQTGFWLWLGLLATTQLSPVFWNGKPWKLYWIETSYNLVSLLLMGLIIGMWL
ncbi:DUF1761 domain-containing protein [Candidatus Nomurabacteria bacterium]|nr:DUF1761 domain-containing protein [Candidatus Nomurabacteria bacterium]